MWMWENEGFAAVRCGARGGKGRKGKKEREGREGKERKAKAKEGKAKGSGKKTQDK